MTNLNQNYHLNYMMSVGDYSHHVSCSSPNYNNNLTATNNIKHSYQYISPTDKFVLNVALLVFPT